MSIYWAIDEKGGLSTLPASPLLFPAFIISILVAFVPRKTKKIPIKINPAQHCIIKQRMDYLLARKYSSTATIAELKELHFLEYPCGTNYPPIRYI